MILGLFDFNNHLQKLKHYEIKRTQPAQRKSIKNRRSFITAKVVLDLGNGNVISAIISKEAIADLDLKPCKSAFAVIESTKVIIGTSCDEEDDKCRCK